MNGQIGIREIRTDLIQFPKHIVGVSFARGTPAAGDGAGLLIQPVYFFFHRHRIDHGDMIFFQKSVQFSAQFMERPGLNLPDIVSHRDIRYVTPSFLLLKVVVITVKILDHLMDRLFRQCAEAVFLLLPGQKQIRDLIKIAPVLLHILQRIFFISRHFIFLSSCSTLPSNMKPSTDTSKFVLQNFQRHFSQSFFCSSLSFAPLSAAYLPVSVDLIFVACQFLQPHRSPRVKHLGADADLRSETEFKTVRKPCGSIHIDAGGIHLP